MIKAKQNIFSLESLEIWLYAIGLIIKTEDFKILLHNRFRDISNSCKVLSRLTWSPDHCWLQ